MDYFLSDWSDAIHNSPTIKTLFDTTQEIVRNPVYHYTIEKSLVSILRSNDLHMTNYRFLNDTSEIQYGYNVVVDLVTNEARAHGSTERSHTQKQFFSFLMEKLLSSGGQQIYVSSFCTVGDRLSQWRAYGDDGKGICVGFDAMWFVSLVMFGRNAIGPFHGSIVEYNPSVQQRIAAEILANFVQKIATQDADANDIADRACNLFRFFIPFFKHPGFEEEREFRYVFAPKPDCKAEARSRSRGDDQIPYYSVRDLFTEVKFPLIGCPIKSVLIGPNPGRPSAAKIRKILRTASCESVTVATSDIPYRS